MAGTGLVGTIKTTKHPPKQTNKQKTEAESLGLSTLLLARFPHRLDIAYYGRLLASSQETTGLGELTDKQNMSTLYFAAK